MTRRDDYYGWRDEQRDSARQELAELQAAEAEADLAKCRNWYAESCRLQAIGLFAKYGRGGPPWLMERGVRATGGPASCTGVRITGEE